MQVEEQLDKILSVVLDIQSKVESLDERIGRLEEAQTGTFQRLDEFIGMMKHQNMELAALGAKYQRLEQRIAALESR